MLHESNSGSSKKLLQNGCNKGDLIRKILGNENIDAIQHSNRKFRNKMIQMGVNLDQESIRVYYGYVNKKSLELQGVHWEIGTYWEVSNQNVINKYLWAPNDEMQNKIWNEVKRVNEDKDDISKEDELYYSY